MGRCCCPQAATATGGRRATGGPGRRWLPKRATTLAGGYPCGWLPLHGALPQPTTPARAWPWLATPVGAWSWPATPTGGLAVGGCPLPHCLHYGNAARMHRTVLHDAISLHTV
ncbi:hypothetical protein BHE74_00034584 [Ensete ventricosum]|nr:hypothetical protein BHE74_00034584 [Ensete ventricosum]